MATGVSVGPPGMFFTAGGRGHHIKFFIIDLQEMRELYITLTCLASCFLLFFYKTAAGKKNEEADESGWGTEQKGPR